MVLHFVFGKIAGNQQPHFQIISEFVIYIIEVRCYMNKSILRKSSQIISNHVMYGRAKTWTCQSLAKDVCKEQMPRCKFQSEMSVKAFLQNITEQMHPEVGVYLQTRDWNEDDSHPNFVEHVNSSTFVFYSSSFELCVHLHGIIVLDIFFINPNSRPLPTFLPFPHGTRRQIQACTPHHRCHPEMPGGGPLPPRSCRERSAPRCESPRDAHLHEQPGAASAAAGKAG